MLIIVFSNHFPPLYNREFCYNYQFSNKHKTVIFRIFRKGKKTVSEIKPNRAKLLRNAASKALPQIRLNNNLF